MCQVAPPSCYYQSLPSENSPLGPDERGRSTLVAFGWLPAKHERFPSSKVRIAMQSIRFVMLPVREQASDVGVGSWEFNFW